jgi:hypothetical protein
MTRGWAIGAVAVVAIGTTCGQNETTKPVKPSSKPPAASVAPPTSNDADLPALTGPGSGLVYAASWFMGNSFPGIMISGAGGR